MNTGKRKAATKLLVAKHSGDEIVLDYENPNYFIQLIQATNWYNINVSEKVLTGYFRTWVKAHDKKLWSYVSKMTLPDSSFRQLGMLARLQDIGSDLSVRELEHFRRLVNKVLQDQAEKVEAAKATAAPVKSIQDRIAEIVSAHCAVIDGEIDSFIAKGGKDAFNPKTYVLDNSIASAIGGKVAAKYILLSSELVAAKSGKDAQLSEGYSNFTKPFITKLVGFLNSIVDALGAGGRVNSKPKATKAKPVSRSIKQLKFKSADKELGVTSANPETIVGAKEVWLYNVKARKLTVLKSDEGISVSGTTLNNISDKSYSQTIRNPKAFFKGLGKALSSFSRKQKALTTKPVAASGRCSIDTLILGAF